MENVLIVRFVFSDDMATIAKSETDLKHNILNEELKQINMKVSAQKTKAKIITTKEVKRNITITYALLNQKKRN